jgi:para-aminobenzoate synthetase component I
MTPGDAEQPSKFETIRIALSTSMFEPIVQSLAADCSPIDVFNRLNRLPYAVLLESTRFDSRLGRYSIFAADPYDVYRLDQRSADPLAGLAKRIQAWPKQSPLAGLPPMQGGAIGMLSYDLGRCFERIPPASHNEFQYPLALIGFYDVVFVWDHELQSGWIISQGLPHTDVDQRAKHASKRLAFFMDALQANEEGTDSTSYESSPWFTAGAYGLTAPQFDTRLARDWIGTFDSQGLRRAVDQVRDYIAAGDVFQVNLAQRLMRPALSSSAKLYEALRSSSPAPFAGYFDGGDFQLISSSPERFLRIDADRWIETRPIKGTRPRGKDVADDARLNDELKQSAKDRAENTMIVDLLRNDLSRVCEFDSISVPEYCVVERYPQVQHLVSAVRGRLRSGLDITDLIAATFPGGSITGAPKVRAMEIIAELEPTARGPYCGSLGYISLDGNSDWNILIRTILAKSGWWQLNVGGGIVYDSQSESEEEETWTKARGMIAAIESVKRLIEPARR